MSSTRDPRDARTIEQQAASGVQQAAENLKKSGIALGNQVDFSRGIPMAPKAGSFKPPEVPRVGIPGPGLSMDRPERAERPESEEEYAARRQREDEDYAASRAAAGAPVQAVDPSQFSSTKNRPAPRAVGKPPKPRLPQAKQHVHSLIQQLRSEFGISKKKEDGFEDTIDVMVADRKWHFRKLPPDLIALAARMADATSRTPSEHVIRAQHASVCCAIVGMNDVPCWKLFNLEIGKDDDVSDPFAPRGMIVERMAFALFAELVGANDNRLMEALYDAYVAKVDPPGKVKGYTTYEKVEHLVWTCPVDDCSHVIHRPRQFDEDGDEMPYFCERHGDEMVTIATAQPRIKDELDPLHSP